MENNPPIYSIRGVIYSRSHEIFNYGQTGYVNIEVTEETTPLQKEQIVNFESDSGVLGLVTMSDVWFDVMAYSEGLSKE